MKVVRQYPEIMLFLILPDLSPRWLPDSWLYPAPAVVLIGNGEILSQLQGSFYTADTVKPGYKINHITVCLTAEAMESFVYLHAWCPIIVKRTARHTMKADLYSVTFCRLPGRDRLLHGFKYIHVHLLSLETKKAPAFSFTE
jgi:hypothetical protein